MTALTRAALAADLAERVFAGPIASSLTPRRLGAEVEFIPVEALTGRRCRPRRFLENGFHFEFPDLRRALADLLPR